MSARLMVACLVVVSLGSPLHAKNKKKQELPDYVLKAQTVVVVTHPDAGDSVADPSGNRTAQENVEKALTTWGRFRVVMDTSTADLVIAVRKGHASGPTIKSSPTQDRPVVIQPGDTGIRIGGQKGRPPDTTDPGFGGPTDKGRGLGNEIGPADDMIELYRGGTEYPLDAPAVWRYMAKGALSAPQVTAVEQLRKVVDESEKQSQQKP